MRGAGMSFDVAWRAARIATCPDEVGYRDYGHGLTQSRKPEIPQESLPRIESD